jgi:hypothetical protein
LERARGMPAQVQRSALQIRSDNGPIANRSSEDRTTPAATPIDTRNNMADQPS